MYKVTAHGKTMYGGNYDAYYLTTKIWFETAKSKKELGAVFSGGRPEGKHTIAPQAGMNEAGLAFSVAVVPTRESTTPYANNKKQINNRSAFLKSVLHQCRTVQEVKNYYEQYNHQVLVGDLFMYVDSTGAYLIVEPDTLILGNDYKYLASNFCPSNTAQEEALKMLKYKRGVDFLKNKLDTSLSFCAALSDSMSVCRPKMGDGTLLTCIRDLNNGIVYFYFYHNFDHVVKFNLKAELAKGDHAYSVPELFPENAEYQRLVNYKTPQNSQLISLYHYISAVFLLVISLFFFISYLRKRKTVLYPQYKLIIVLMGPLLAAYLLILTKVEYIFYFPAPYRDHHFSYLNIAAYIPFLLALVFIPLISTNKKVIKEKEWHPFTRTLFTLTNLHFLSLIILFVYWGLYTISY